MTRDDVSSEDDTEITHDEARTIAYLFSPTRSRAKLLLYIEQQVKKEEKVKALKQSILDGITKISSVFGSHT